MDITPLPAGDIEGAIRFIQEVPFEKLQDAAYIEHVMLPTLGFNNEILEEFPVSLLPWCGHGIKSWQYPKQFSKYLVSLSKKNIKSYAEVGCRHGGTFIITLEYLKRFNPIESALAIDIARSDIMQNYCNSHKNTKYLISSSRSEESISELQSRQWDLVLIDGDHSTEGCLHDYIATKNHAKYLALHDVISDACVGVKNIWNLITSILPDRKTEAFTEQYDEVITRTGKKFLGLGIAILE
ncbi:class I SAM-dependent methyltransferase [Acetobacter estunensis]|uniref:class I SAM-dependent methyltransferase n=1 Tax=Acetobacter estunensis TaxID=104097 RepID=UPI001C2DC5D9|nr:class I SAM-dependent methyltransferase [Acetobacter estunensis]MBV1837485.1 class I SAM-dependent methyltransferase [Acetobacter estunensis]